MVLLIILCASLISASALALPADLNSIVHDKAYNATRMPGLTGFGHRTTGGTGGAIWTVWDAFALRSALDSTERRIIYIRGRIDLTPLFTGSPGVWVKVGPYKSIIGGDGHAEIFGGGLSLTNAVHVIIQNVKFANALSYAPGEQPNGNGGIISMAPGDYSDIDAIGVRKCEHVWIDHCEFSDDPWNAVTTPQRRHDGLIDIVEAANWITISNSIFRNHNMNMLIGNGDDLGWQDTGKLKTTYYLNWFQGTNQRNPFVRFGEVHILNNLYSDNLDYGIGIGTGAQVIAERNVFINNRRAWTTGNPNPPGHFRDDNNILINSRGENIPRNVQWNPHSYYGYSAMNVNQVEAHVRRYAGTW